VLTISLSFGAEGAASHLLLRVGAIPRGGRVGDKEREKGSKGKRWQRERERWRNKTTASTVGHMSSSSPPA
jgi:hypothetical protein